MALLFVDGFDHYATADITKKWAASVNASINTTAGRRGGGALVGVLYNYVQKTLPSSHGTIIVGFAYKPSTLSNLSQSFLSLWDGTVEHLAFSVNASGQIVVFRGAHSATLATGTAALSTSVFNYVEIKATISDTVGSVVIKVNGVTDINLTGADTQNGGTSTITRVYIGTPSNSNNGYPGTYDDFYICDTSGATNNDFLGDCRIDTIMPTGDGNYSQFTPSTGTAHWSLVDEKPANTTDYVSDATSGDRDSYTFPALSSLSSQTVYGVQVNAYSQKSDAGARSLGTMTRLSGTNSDGASVALPTSWSFISQIYETDPASAAWTESNVNAAEFGVKVTA